MPSDIRGRLIYLASPYSHTSATIENERYEAACRSAAEFIKAGIHVYSPIAHSHPIATIGGLDVDFRTWQELDFRMIESCDEMWVLCLDGHDDSIGVAAEVEHATGLGMPVRHVAP